MGMTETASRIIKRFGQAGTLRQTVNIGTPWDPVQTVGDTAITVAVVDYAQEVRDGTLIQSGDLRALVSVEGLSVTPTTADKLIVGGVEYVIVRASPHAPDGVPRFHDLQVRT
ncbi:MAG: hypothetical protein CVT70_16420 [Alphaproteobacteria bacterium HGW-Alphaproteobacteria-1]|jgi:hypothetical protein|nr:MAG: hypothetical protein CVT70_16420 [Alphaproteobacteria bacterium HGW-Alphaproteobacteria-1]